jgi:hypothetical protein
MISSTGDNGDCIYLLNIISQIPGGPHTLSLRSSKWTKAKDDEGLQRLFANLEKLVRLQPYIRDINLIGQDDPVDWRSEDFRERHFSPGETLMQAHLNHLIKKHGIGRGFTAKEPWLHGVEPSAVPRGRVVINRTSRYRNDRFPWTEIVAHYGSRLLFIGLEHEWREFVNNHGYVSHHPTANLLEMAQVIKGSDLFIGNQSCAYALAEGMKHHSIQESNLELPDCVYVRPNATYVADGVVTLPDGTVLRGKRPPAERRTHVTPPGGGWRYAEYLPSPVFELLVKEVAQRENLSIAEAGDRVYSANVERCPDFFADPGERARYLKFEQAIENSRP